MSWTGGRRLATVAAAGRRSAGHGRVRCWSSPAWAGGPLRLPRTAARLRRRPGRGQLDGGLLGRRRRRGAALPGVRRALRRPAGGRRPGRQPTCTSSRCRCWSETACVALAVPAAVGADARPVAARRCCAGSARTRRAPTPASGARCAPSRSRDEHQHVVDLRAAALLCTCRPCYLLFTAEGAAAALPRGARPLPVRSRTSARPRASGTSCRSRSALAFFFLNSALGRTVALLPEPGRRHRVASCRSDAWDAIVARQPGAGAARARRRGAARACTGARRAASRATWCRSTRCYELVGRLRLPGAASTAARRRGRCIDEFFADLARAAGLRRRRRPADEPS